MRKGPRLVTKVGTFVYSLRGLRKEGPSLSAMWLLLKAVLILELLNTSTGVDELLLTCKERMAL